MTNEKFKAMINESINYGSGFIAKCLIKDHRRIALVQGFECLTEDEVQEFSRRRGFDGRPTFLAGDAGI